MNADIEEIIIAVTDPYGFLPLTVDLNFLHAGITAHPMIHMHDEITGFEIQNFFEGEFLRSTGTASGFVFVESLKELMLRPKHNFAIMVGEACMQAYRQWNHREAGFQVFENLFQPFDLSRIISTNGQTVPLGMQFPADGNKASKLFANQRLCLLSKA